MADAAPATDPLDAPEELIRSAAKWMVASLGAIGVVLVAGSQVSSLGKLEAGWRFVAAICGFATGIVSVFVGIWLVGAMLVPRKWTSRELAEEWKAAQPIVPDGLDKSKRKKWPVIHFFASNPEYLGGFQSIPNIVETFDAAEANDPDLPALIKVMNEINRIARYRSAISTYNRTRTSLIAVAALSAVGVGVFAWAANPPDPQPAVVQLRHADLSDTDLSGADFDSADLTGVDFSNSDLSGASLDQAELDTVEWSNTICPDGVNSDNANDSCDAHLVPG